MIKTETKIEWLQSIINKSRRGIRGLESLYSSKAIPNVTRELNRDISIAQELIDMCKEDILCGTEPKENK